MMNRQISTECQLYNTALQIIYGVGEEEAGRSQGIPEPNTG